MKVVGIERDSTNYLWELNYQLTQEFEHYDQLGFPLKVCKTSFLLKKNHILTWNYLSTQLGHCKCHVRMHALVMSRVFFLVNEVLNPTLGTLACSWWASLLSHQPLLNFGWIFCKRVLNLWKFESNGQFVISFIDE